MYGQYQFFNLYLSQNVSKCRDEIHFFRVCFFIFHQKVVILQRGVVAFGLPSHKTFFCKKTVMNYPCCENTKKHKMLTI